MTFPQRQARWLKWFDPRSGHASGNALRIAAVSLWVLVLGVGYALLISWLDPALPWPVKLEREPWFLTILNVVPVLMLCALLTVVTGRMVLASWLTLLVLALLYAINTAKVAQLATPLLPDDLFFLRELRLNYAFFSTYLAFGVTQLLIAAAIVTITLALTREAVMLRLSRSRRALFAVAILGAGVSLLYGAGPWNQLYNPGRLQFEPWAPADSAQRTGLITNLILLHWELQIPRTAEPDVVAATRLLENVDSSARSLELAGPVGDLPDIIVVQSESLFDPSRLNAVADSHLPNLRSWSSRGWSGDLKVPTLGGGTIRTEFEMLTGLPLEAFPEVRYPYLQLPRKQVPSFVRTLAAHGYRSLAIHPNGGAFWNRNQAFHAFGFDRFIDGKAFAGSAREGWHVSDAALTDRVIAELQDEGPPQFIMAISIQNHGPYTLSPADDPAADAALGIVPATLEATSAAAWQNYLRLLRRSDAELGRLATYLQQRERRTLLLFYSDHMPPLNTVFASVGFADGRPAQQQPVPWLLLDNRSSQQRSENTASWLLPALLLTKAGIRGRDYFDFLESLRERWTEAELQTDEMRLAIAAVAQLQYRDELQSTMQRLISLCGQPECSDPL